MDLALLRFLAMTLTPAITAAARPGLTFAVVQTIAAVLVWTGQAALPDGLGWMVSPSAVVLGLLFGVLETAARHDPDVDELLAELHLDKVVGAFGALAAPLLFAALGLPETESMALSDTVGAGASGQTGATLATIVTADQPPIVTAAAVGGAVGINATLIWARAQVLEFLREFDVAKVWLRVETGGAVIALILLPLLPGLTLLVGAVFALGLGALTLMVRGASRAHDRLVRVACPSCDHQVRPEASGCPSCGASLTPTRLLDQPGLLRRGWGAALAELRQRRQALAA